MANSIKKRSEVDKKYTWATEDLFVSDEAWEKALKEEEKNIEKIVKFKGISVKSAENLLNVLKEMENQEVLLGDIFSYAARKSDEDTTNSFYQDFMMRARNLGAKFGQETSFLTTDIMTLTNEELEKFYSECKELENYRRHLTDLRRLKDHILSEKEEELMANASKMSQSPYNIFSMFTNADIKYPDVIDENGKPAKLTQGTFISYLENPNREVRKDAFKKYYATLKGFENTLASAYSAQVESLMFEAKSRKYNSTIEAALDGNNVPVSVYKNLIKAVEENMHYMHKYVKLRKKLLGYDDLHMYDLYTTVVNDVDVKIDFEDAKKTVYDAVAPLGADYQAILKEGFDNRWIDVYENIGKRGGAYSSGANKHPFVLLNYSGTLDSEFTLAHEMGHAIHSYFSHKNQRPIDSNYRIFVAEVASTCNEALLMEHLLKNTTDKMQRAYLINHFLEQFRGTIYRQTMFAEFEMLTNEMAEKGQSLTAETLNKLYYDLNVKYYGKDIVVDEDIAQEWERIPHFYYNFYVFQYATGYSAAIALSRKILDEGETAVANYKKFLSGGCTQSPIDLLKIAGVDMGSPEPINQALALFGKLIDELDELLA